MNSRGRIFGMPFRFDSGSVSSFVVNSLYLVRGGSGFRDSGSVSSFVVNSLYLVRGGSGFRRPLPNSMPVGSRTGGSTSPS